MHALITQPPLDINPLAGLAIMARKTTECLVSSRVRVPIAQRAGAYGRGAPRGVAAIQTFRLAR